MAQDFCIHWEIIIFAPAMGSYDLHKLKLEALSMSGADATLTLDEAFFASLEQEEILGGLLAINLIVQKRAGNAYEINYAINGHVDVNCDRCLHPLSYPIDFEGSILVDAYDEDGYELLDREGSYDATWDIYEAILLELPLQRCHEEGQCDPEQELLLQSITVE